MKQGLRYFSVLMPLVAAGCSVNSYTPTPTLSAFGNGVYSGKFTAIHLHQKTGVSDTTIINLSLTLSASNAFLVEGDTTLHAASTGAYAIGANTLVQFIDKTLPANGVSPKIHLNGLYLYNYTGSSLSLGAASAFDTVRYYYNLQKQ